MAAQQAKQEKHVHKLKKIRFKSGNTFFFCTLPDCSFKVNPALALGKRCLCWRCGQDFILDEYSIRLVKPHCRSCHKPKNEVTQVKIEFVPPIGPQPTTLNLSDLTRKGLEDEEGDI